jgi:hypothetical protein
MLAPERRHDAELCKGRLSAEQANDPLILVRRESMLGDERRRDDRITGTRLGWHQCGAAAESFFGTMTWYREGAAGGRGPSKTIPLRCVLSVAAVIGGGAARCGAAFPVRVVGESVPV